MKTKRQIIKSLATEFSQTFNQNLVVVELPDHSLSYQNYIIKLVNHRWRIFNHNLDEIDSYNLKSCALLAAKHRYCKKFNQLNTIRLLDENYSVNYHDVKLYESFIQTVDQDRYDIILSRLDYARQKSDFYKSQITKLFRKDFR